MRPMISPRGVANRVGSGLITAAKNSVSKIKESTQRISKVSDKDQKFVMNYVQFFGNKKTAKILKKSLESIKQSIVATLEIASTLKKFIGEASKMMKKRGGGLFTGGGIGGLIGGGLGLLFGKGALITLGLLAAGGIVAILYQYREEVFDFLKDFITSRRNDIEDIVRPVIREQIERAFYPQKFRDEDVETEGDRKNRIRLMMQNNPGMSEDDAFDLVTSEMMDEILPTRKGTNRNQKARYLSDLRTMSDEKKRKKNFLEGGVNRGILNDKGKVVPLSSLVGKQFTDPFNVNVTGSYLKYNPERKFKLLKQELDLEKSLSTSKDKAEKLILSGEGTKPEKAFASDLLKLISELRVSGKGTGGLNDMKGKDFSPSVGLNEEGNFDTNALNNRLGAIKSNIEPGVASPIRTKDIQREFPGTVVPFNSGQGGNKRGAGMGGGGGGEVLNGSNESGTSTGTNGYLRSSNPDDSTLKCRTTLEIC